MLYRAFAFQILCSIHVPCEPSDGYIWSILLLFRWIVLVGFRKLLENCLTKIPQSSRGVLVFVNRNLFWKRNLGVPNRLCKIPRTVLLEISEIVTCLIFTIFILSQTLSLLPNCRTLSPHIFFCLFIVLYPSEIVPLFLFNCHKCLCNVFPLLRSGHSTLLFPFVSLMNHSRDYLMSTVTHFSIVFRSLSHWKCPRLLV